MISLLILISTIAPLLESCPPGNYVKCSVATEANDYASSCRISGTIQEGYVSYGANGRYTLIPFTNTAGDTLDIDCDDEFGDIVVGTHKECCYIEVANGFGQDFAWDGPDAEGAVVAGPNLYRYGANNKYIYRVLANVYAYCTAEFFNHLLLGIPKHCEYNSYSDALPPLPIRQDTTWTLCGNEGHNCKGLNAGSANWVRYGHSDDGYDNYYYKLVVSDAVPCNSNYFGDPTPGHSKYCWRANNAYTFSNIVGKWHRVPACISCASNVIRITTGITGVTASERSTEWQKSLTTTMSAGFEFFGASASVEMSASASKTETLHMSSSIEQSSTKEVEYTCEKDRVYQWITEATQNNGVTVKDFTIKTPDYLCADLKATPICPPSFCADKTCETCKDFKKK